MSVFHDFVEFGELATHGVGEEDGHVRRSPRGEHDPPELVGQLVNAGDRAWQAAAVGQDEGDLVDRWARPHAGAV